MEDLNNLIDELTIGDGRGMGTEIEIRGYAADLKKEIEKT